MRIAVSGAGSFAKLLAEELPAAGHEVIILTRSHKDFFVGKSGVVEQRITDYTSVPKLTEQLRDCDALVCTIADYSQGQGFLNAHMALIEACKQSPKCKRFIPSEFGGNTEAFPEPADSLYYNNRVIKDALKAQTDIEWTTISLGWVMDYLIPSVNRYIYDIGPLHPLDLHTKTMTIPGSGNEMFTITSARDATKAIAQLFTSPREWRNYTYVQGEETTWRKVAEVVKTIGGVSDLTVTFESVDELTQIYERKESAESAAVAEFKLYVPSGYLTFDQSKVQRDRDEFFPSLRFQTIGDMLTTIQKNSQAMV